MAESGQREWWFSAVPHESDRKQPGAPQEQAHSVSLPPVSLPKGGGAIKGIDEQLAVNRATGTASLSLGVFSSPGRSGFGPSLALAYDSGAGNGPFGLGWSVSVPQITRKTSKGLPLYNDAAGSDVFILSGAEDLVPLLVDGAPPPAPPRVLGGRTFDVTAYRPRVESGFARIERWQDTASGDVHWRTISRENVTSLYGQDPASRIADPQDATRIFTWLLDLSFDDRGNAVSYTYKPEDGVGVAVAANEANRLVSANRYLKRIRYGNRTPYTGALPQAGDWCFELVLDYGEHDLTTPTPDDTQAPWTCREDAFSTYRSCFEVRTFRRCRRLLMFHNFATGETPTWVLVRSTDITYVAGAADASLPTYSLLTSVTQTGWVPDGSGGYTTSSLPPVDLGYQPLAIDETLQVADDLSLQNVTGAGARWIDVNGEGLKGLLTEDERAWYYKRNVSAWNPDGGPPRTRLEPLVVLAEKPAAAGLTLSDLNGDGNLCAVKLAPPDPGWFEYTPDAGWSPYRQLEATASLDWASPELRILDVTGDGLADVLVCEDDAFSWNEWIVDSGFAAAARVPKPFDEERGPAIVFADPTACVLLADMSGDGLTDLVRIRSGEVCYWPNLGYGRFGAKVAMDASPAFDYSDRFDARRVRLADIDGSGTADLFYLAEETTIWFNQSGSSWTAPQVLAQAPRFAQGVDVDVLDLLGTGTACLVWSSAFPGDAQQPLRYIDLTGSKKPFLLTTVTNNFGAQRTIAYAPSTKFYLQDRAAERPWLTRLPFPVHVVERLDTTDAVSGTSCTSCYSYHHGYYDGVEREFRGFARVDAIDTDTVPAASGIGGFTSTPTVVGEEFELPPVLTRTWFHTGAFFGWGDIAAHLQLEYWALDPDAPQLAPTVLPAGAGPEDLREAARALRGHVLREEVYALDCTGAAVNPYLTREHRYEVNQLQPSTAVQYGSFYPWELEAISCEYERSASDPRVGHTLTLAIDEWGNVTQQATVAYARRATLPPSPQGVTTVRYLQSDFAQIADAVLHPDVLRIGVPVETRAYELTGIDPALGALYDPTKLGPAAATAGDIPYDATPSGGPQRRMLARRRTYYRSDDLTTTLALEEIESLAIVDKSYTQRYTSGLLASVYGASLDASVLSTAGALVDLDNDGGRWAPSAKLFYSNNLAPPDAAFAAANFYLPQGSVDPWGNESTVSYDSFLLLPVSSKDAVGNVTSVENNYRVLAPWLLTDANLNRNGVRYDALGMVLTTAAMGKQLSGGENEGDSLDTSTDEPSPNDSPTTKLVYSLTAYAQWAAGPAPNPDHPIPVNVQTFARIQHKEPNWLQSFAYMDGLGRVALTKAQAEPGPAPQWAGDGTLVKDPQTGAIVLADTDSRWVGSGRVVYDNKGNPVKAYEPFFDSNSDYVVEAELVEWGVTALTRRDPLGRVIRVDNPDGTLRTVTFDPWQTTTYDENDTVRESAWYIARSGGALGAAQLDAAQKALPANDTPTRIDLDPLGRTFQSTADNGAAGNYTTVFTLDIDGNQLVVEDALGRAALTRTYDMTGAEIYSSSIDAGARRVLLDTGGQPIQAWDSRGFIATMSYDALRRPTKLFVAPAANPSAQRLAEQVIYGETLGFGPLQAPALNLCGVAYQQYDEAGVASTDRRDFQGNTLSVSRKLLANTAYDTDVDWSQPPQMPEQYTATATYDALNRKVTATTPDGSVTTTTFNERSLLAAVEVAIRGAAATAFVTAVSYDAKGQRENIAYGNGASTAYTYDPDTFRLTGLQTTRPGAANPLQDLSYAYDPVGNVTSIADAAQQTNFYNNQVVTPSAEYTYDAIYRLVSASGREHIGQTTAAPVDWDDAARMAFPLPLANDAQAMRNYRQTYEYDAVDNILGVVHTAAGGGWTRTYNYPSASNRLASSTVAGTTEPYAYDAHGNITSMPHLSLMEWDWKDQLQATATQVVNDGTPETTYYRYDGAGQRIVKATYNQRGNIVSRRVYLGAYELYREYAAGGAVSLERETLHVSDGKQRISLVETVTLDTSSAAAAAAAPTPLLRYQLGNHLGSAILELDGSAALLSYEEYYPYGSTSFQSGSSVAEVGLKRYRYTGKERDGESGFYYHGARYYAPWLGRWTAVDPARAADGSAPYVYVQGRPIVANDPDGRFLNIVIGAVAGFLLGGGIEIARQLITEGRITDPGRIGAAALGGLVGGAVAGATFGGSLVLEAAGVAVGAAAGGTVTRLINNEPTTPARVAVDVAVGLATFGVLRGAGAGLSALRGAATEGAASEGGSVAAGQRGPAAPAEPVESPAGAPAPAVQMPRLQVGHPGAMLREAEAFIMQQASPVRQGLVADALDQVKAANPGWKAAPGNTPGGGVLYAGEGGPNWLFAARTGEVFKGNEYTPDLLKALISGDVQAIREQVQGLPGIAREWLPASAPAAPAPAAPIAPPSPATVQLPANPGRSPAPSWLGGTLGSQADKPTPPPPYGGVTIFSW
jgi:RHS repeat-associated protein